MPVSAQNLCRLAGELNAEHGTAASAYALRAYRASDAEGDEACAELWLLLSILVDDVAMNYFDPDLGPSIQ